MGRKRDRTETEHLRGAIKKLIAENRRLKKQTNSSKKRLAAIEEAEDSEIEEIAEYKTEGELLKTSAGKKCPHCNSELDSVEMGPRTLYFCDDCRYRRTEATNGKKV